jgi:hypothetical protein
MSGSLTADELELLAGLLERFAENDLGQHEAWRLETSHGPAYVRMTRKPAPDESADTFRLLTASSPYSTGRPAHVSDLSTVSSRNDVLRIVGEMLTDYEGSGASEWENATLARFLAAFGGFLHDLDGYFANRAEPMPAQPNWALLATLLVAASGYE